jgi:hypothetical protein
MYDMMLGQGRRSNVCVHPERYPTYLKPDAVIKLRNFLNTDPRHRLGQSRYARSNLMNPFFKTVNWEAVLQKCVISTVKFFTVDPTHLAMQALEKKTPPSKTHREDILEQPTPQSLTAKCSTMDQKARGDDNGSRSDSLFSSLSDAATVHSSSIKY